MPKVVLEFEVTQKGATVSQVVSETERAFTALKSSAAGATETLDRTTGAAGRSALDFRTLRMGISDLSMAFGSVSPALTTVGLGFGHVAERMSGLSGSAKLVAGSIFVAAGTVAYLFAQFKEADRIAERFATIDRAMKGLDTGAIESGLKETVIQLEVLGRQGETAVGRVVRAFADMKAQILGVPPPVEEAKKALEKLREAMTRITAIQWKQDIAVQAGAMAGLNITAIQQRAQSSISRQVATPASIETFTGLVKAEIDAQVAAAIAVLEFELQKALAQAESHGTKDIEEPRLQAEYEGKAAEVRAKGEIQATAAAEQGRQQRTAIAAQEMAEQTAIARQGMTQRLAIATQEEAMFAAIRQAGTSLAAADVSGGEIERMRQVQAIEMAGIRDTLAATRQASTERIGEADRLRTQLLAMLQGQLAQQLIGERDYSNQVRQLDTELTNTKIAALGQYSQALQAALARDTADYTKYTDQIRRLDEQMRQTKNETADILAGIKQAGMSPAEAFADREKRAQEKLAQAMSLSGQDQVDALKAIQREYADLAVEATRSGQAQEAAAKQARDAWVSELPAEAATHAPGQVSQAWGQMFPKQTPPAGGDYWSTATPGGYWGTLTKSQAQAADPKALADKVTAIGKQIEEAQNKAKAAAEDSAKAAKAAAEEHVKALETIKAQLDAVQGPTEKLEQAFRNAASSTGSIQTDTAKLAINLDLAGARAEALTARLSATAQAAMELAKAIGTIPALAGLTLAGLEGGAAGAALRGSMENPTSSGGATGSSGIGSYESGTYDPGSSGIGSYESGTYDPGSSGIGSYESGTYDPGSSGIGSYESGTWEGQHGGVVPGPTGAPRRGLVHGGELLLNPAEQAVIRGITGGAGIDPQALAEAIARALPDRATTKSGGEQLLNLRLVVDGHDLARGLRIPLSKLIASGEMEVHG